LVGFGIEEDVDLGTFEQQHRVVEARAVVARRRENLRTVIGQRDEGFAVWSSSATAFPNFDFSAQPMHDLCMATKTISIEIDAYELLVRERRDPKESFSRVIRRVLSERPALTAGDLLDAMKAFEGRGAGPRRRRSRDAAA
jgi:Putative antitoxin